MRRQASYGSDYGGRYDRPLRGAGGGARPHGYDRETGRYGTPMPGAAGFPSARWGWGPIGWMGWGPGMEFWPYADVPNYGFDGTRHVPRRPPRESPSYGRRADQQLQRWARSHGYDRGYEIRPRRGR